ncbi:MAG: RDD family protein [Proteobacteria bacterium]|nr:RDD family protein [Pseudomonadota bacterium]
MNETKLWKHFASLLYDLFPIAGIILLTSTLVLLVRSGREVEPQSLWFQLVIIAEIFLYFAYSWKKGGQTLGMRAWRIIITDYQKLTWKDVTLRFLAGIISTLLLGAGLWTRRWHKHKRTWMDSTSQSYTQPTKSSPPN